MSVSKRLKRLAALAVTAFAAMSLSLALATAPAAADVSPNAGVIDTSSSSLVTSEDVSVLTREDECEGDKCKKIPWCPPAGVSGEYGGNDVPVLISSDIKDAPRCVKRPIIKWECCVKDGKQYFEVKVTNPNGGSLKIRIKLGSGAWVEKLVAANSTATYTFADVSYGHHTLVAQVWAGEKGWCEFKQVRVPVKCLPPSASPSTSPSPSPSSPIPSVSTTPGQELPQTGSSVGTLATTGGLALLAGVGLIVVARRRRDIATETDG